jgi:hypothetical protein
MSCLSILNPSAEAHGDASGNPVLSMNYQTQGAGSMTDAKGINFFINGVKMSQMGGDGLYMVNYMASFEAAIVPGGIVSGQVKNIIIRVVCKDGTHFDSPFSYTIPTPIPGVTIAPAPAKGKGKRK